MLLAAVLERVKLCKLLSFGAEPEPVDLGSLNVLIGPNGSGKTNFIEAIGLLHQAPTDLGEPIREGGGIRSWIWKGESDPEARELGGISIQIRFGNSSDFDSMEYELTLRDYRGQFDVFSEDVSATAHGQSESRNILGRVGSKVFVAAQRGRTSKTREKSFDNPELDNQRSILSQTVEGHVPQHVNKMISFLKEIRLYRNWRMGRDSPARFPQPADLRNDFLEENGRNLSHVLNQFRSRAKLKQNLIENLRRFLEDAEDIDILVQGGTLQLYLQEKSFEDAIPATRLSDGTLRWLCLLAILLHPSPPPLVCLEEPEVGLHPDMMHVLAELLRDASERMQLIVTTHSEALVDALSSTPEAVIVCEREEGSTRMRRLDKEKLAIWLEQYSLGHLWRSGQIGGNRW